VSVIPEFGRLRQEDPEFEVSLGYRAEPVERKRGREGGRKGGRKEGWKKGRKEVNL
jgi:hypothetical protein